MYSLNPLSYLKPVVPLLLPCCSIQSTPIKNPMHTIRALSMVMSVLSRCSFFRPTSSPLKPTNYKPPTSLLTTLNCLPYGPSLLKGRAPHQLKDSSSLKLLVDGGDPDGISEEELIKEENFTRVFEVSALRVPSRECFWLEARIRGHLLNWPRVKNIARVPGDEVDDEVVSLLGVSRGGGEGSDMVALERRVYGKAEGEGEELSPVLYREKLAKEFNARGFVKFRNLARISRPGKKGKGRNVEGKGKGTEIEWSRKGRRDDFALVEVVEEDEDGDDWSGLLGDEGRKGRWRGSTRLLLLDERYVDKGLEDLPQAIKAALLEAADKSSAFTYELVKCKLTLSYDYWEMNEILETLLPKDVIIPSAFESAGHIAHLNLKGEHLPYKRIIAKVVLDKKKPKIQTVVNKIDMIQNEFRTMQLEVLAGNHSLVTMLVENGLRFHVDLGKVFWNSRLATERLRIVRCFTRDDVVCDVFAGVGPISIAAGKVVKRVYANDLNPQAVDYLEKNIIENKLEKKIRVFNMDGRRFIAAMFASDRAQTISHVIMNLPNDAVYFLDAFRGVFRDKTKIDASKLPMIHLYGFSKAEDPEFDFHERIRISLEEVAVNVEMRRVLPASPGKWMLCASFRLPPSVAFANKTYDETT